MSKHRGSVVCAVCDRPFASIIYLQQHARDKRHNLPTQAPVVQAQPPAKQPQVQTETKPVSTPPVSETLGKITCEHCLAVFTSSKDLKQHKIGSHGWKCSKCPGLPPFEDGVAWQAHFNAVHVAIAQSGEIKGTKGEKVAALINKGKINDQHVDVNFIETQSVAKQAEPPSSDPANVKGPIISSPLSEVSTSGVNQDQIALPSSDDKHLSTSTVESCRTSPSSEDHTVSSDERDPLSPKGSTMNLLIEIDPDPRRGRDEATYEIASDTWSPTVTVSSTGADRREGGDDIDMSPSDSLEPLNGSSLQKERHITVLPRGPRPGGQERRALLPSGAIVTGNNPRYEPDVQAQNGLGGVMSSNAKEGYEPPTSITFGSRDWGVDTIQGDLPRDPLRTHRSQTGSAEVHFHCRICLSDPTPTSNLTATHCGHLFCYECIAAEVLGTSRCPVCGTVLALYCLFKLDVAS